MLSKIAQFLKRDYLTLNRIEISRSALLNNFSCLSALNLKLKIAPVLKSNAYGHGIMDIAKILNSASHMASGSTKLPFLCVDSLHEAYQLLKAHIKIPILIMGYTNPENFKVKKLPFEIAVWDLETARVLNQYQLGCEVHIFVDTGMHREGVPISQLRQFLLAVKQLRNLKVTGLMSHLASAESAQDPLFKLQIKNFKLAKELISKADLKLKWFHIGASDSILNPDTRKVLTPVSNLARCGISLYGATSFMFTPPMCKRELKPVLKFKTKIIQIRQLKKDDKVGYGGTFTAKKDTSLGVLPVGYNDGVDRRLSNKGWVLVDEVRCKIVGRVSMNLTVVDISKVGRPYIGQEVEIYPDLGEAAKLCNTIPYELLVHLHPSTRRVVVE